MECRELTDHWEVIFQQNTEPCLIAEAGTYKILYLNQMMGELLGGRDEFLGRHYYDVIRTEIMKSATDLMFLMPHFDWREKRIYRNRIFNSTMDKMYDTTTTLVEYRAKPYLLMKCIPLNEKKNKDYDFDLAMSRCVNYLKQDEVTKTKSLLQLLGEFYHSDSVYMYVVDNQKKKVNLTQFWRSPRVAAFSDEAGYVKHLEKMLDFEDIMTWMDARNELGLLETSKSRPSKEVDCAGKRYLDAFDLENIVLHCMEDRDGMALAGVALVNCDSLILDYRLLQTVTEFLRQTVDKTDGRILMESITEKDVLTGFYSRRVYSEKVESCHMNPPKTLGIIFANVNGLKQVNSEYGYATGDGYIKKAAEILESHFHLPFYRISGDEFVAFVENISKEVFESQVLTLREHLVETDTNVLALGHGWASGRVDVVGLIKEAETVMYINKQEYYHSSNRSYEDINDSTLSDLLSYLANDEFMIYLQPQVYLETGKLYGAEALIRRYDKTNEKMVFPDQFIPLYEKKSVIRHVDIFVVEQVCQLLHGWEMEGRVMFPVSVNLSRVTLQEYGIVDTIAKICDKFSIPRRFLVIEVTERVGLIENNVASTLISDFKEKGFHISLDDFGCAYSNIVTLAQIDVDEVKLDKSLIDEVTIKPKNQVLVENVLRMCSDLGNISTLAEGIETLEQAILLKELRCHLGQGYYFSRPIPVKEFCEKYMDNL